MLTTSILPAVDASAASRAIISASFIDGRKSP
jgi:hypothetical protein